MLKVDNAIIMAAGTSSRFAPLSFEKPKAMTVVKGEVLIERQIEQLRHAGINEIYVVIGYKAEQFEYLVPKYSVRLLHNSDYLSRNNNGSIWVARKILGNSYVCSSDNYFEENPFERQVEDAYYAALYAEGHTEEWCMSEDEDGYINSVTIGGSNAWYMLGHTFWSQNFTKSFLDILAHEYVLPETAGKLWEKIFMSHLDVLKMKIKRYAPNLIHEFDSLDDLREFDASYINDTRSSILKQLAKELVITEKDMVNFTTLKSTTATADGFEFDCPKGHFQYLYEDKKLLLTR